MKRVTFELDGVALRRRAGDRERAILDGVTTTIGAAVTIVAGPSGAGKTSLLRLLNGLDSPTAGRLHCEGRDMHDWPPRDLRRRVGMVAQQPPAIAESATAELALAAELAGVDFDEAHARAVAERLDLDEALLSQHGSDLSVGERPRHADALEARPFTAVLLETATVEPIAFEPVDGTLSDSTVRLVGWMTHRDAPARPSAAEAARILLG